MGAPALRGRRLLWHDLLAQAQSLAGRRALGQDPSPHAGPAQPRRRDRLVARVGGFFVRRRQKGGEAVGPNPTDRGRPGTKRHIVVDRGGLPLAVVLTGANRHDSKVLAPVVDAIAPVRRRRGRPRKRPKKLHADKAYDHAFCRRELRRRNITPRIARRGVESSVQLGKHRWVVERTFAWINQFRRLVVRYERHAELYRAFILLAAAIICFRALHRFC